MKKKAYIQPTIFVYEADMKQQILAGSVNTTGLGNNPEDDLTQDDTPGNVWEEAMSRRRDEWDDDE